MTPAFESFVARLYVDSNARLRFLADPAGEATRAGLSSGEVAALTRIDRIGLELAAASFAQKRQQHMRRLHPFVRLWNQIRPHVAQALSVSWLTREATCGMRQKAVNLGRKSSTQPK